METKQRRGPLSFNIGNAPSTNRINSIKKQTMPFKSTYVSQNLNCKFKPPQDMRLSEEHINLAMYIFSSDNDMGENLVHIHDTTASRADLFYLVPGNQVSELMIKLMALKATSNIDKSEIKKVWSLPTSFADDVSMCMEDHELVKKYAHYMPATADLQFIYVPIMENGGDHWYLMVMSIPDKILYHLTHTAILKTMNHGTALSEIIFLEDYAECGLQKLVNFEGWDVGNAIGIPKCTNRNDSAVWVIQWMDIQEEFIPVVPPKLHEEWTRMYSALDLIIGEWNEVRADVDERFQKWWLNLRQSNVY
ncbi:hypothetical protein PIB30_100655 [Stylosanthes scabra]|uniref:Ubiquitin-like protease family profile domain-containing protein n=1 Tax=Stylosanthes scabra TaxID=79078 RepID=A0ABU6WVF1_9FABA|nr:hypothetical protein [Stylosanthes scabra]